MLDPIWMQSLAEDGLPWHRLRAVGLSGMVTSCLQRMTGEIRVNPERQDDVCPACARQTR